MCLMDIMIFLITIICVLLGVRYYQNYARRKNMPPGPRGIPFIGNALAIAKELAIHKTLSAWAQKYGDIYR